MSVAGNCVWGGPKVFSVGGLQCRWLGGVLKDGGRKGGRLEPLYSGDVEHGPCDQMAWFISWPCHLLTISLWTNDSPVRALVLLSIKMEFLP